MPLIFESARNYLEIEYGLHYDGPILTGSGGV
jgi:hypothetical protein